ncbi:mitochondrial ATPase expression-domain-containing protein [Elsinoe ampelina]|uniref:Mitochondrial ATPase expression-domain-containing protein n=1 Tax=Elsinoe ampelina TaxID=302913 RepID=A0A6A6GJX9_9PEZI|nr:mitochondrial ATPase expression-domain-containing protein [Elsinoe ampelina]
MAALLVRAGPIESRIFTVLCRPRERTSVWVCGECRGRIALGPSGAAPGSGIERCKRNGHVAEGSRDQMVGRQRRMLHTSTRRRRDNGASLDQVGSWGGQWSEHSEDGANAARQRKIVEQGEAQKSSSQSRSQDQDIFTANQQFPDDPLESTGIEEAVDELRMTADHSVLISELQRAVAYRSPDRILKGMLDMYGVVIVPDALFTQALEVVCSNAVFGDLIRKHATTNELHAHLMRVKPLSTVVAEYLEAVQMLAGKRRGTGKQLCSEDYGYLLRASHLVGNDSAARTFWSWMLEDEAMPDLMCYNNYLGAHVWNDILPEYRTRSRVTSFNMVARDNFYSGAPFNNYKIREGGIKELTTKLFGELLKNKYQADEETICHVMAGLAREGDVKGFQKLLARVWDIDPDRIMREDDRAPKKQIPRDSPLFPSERLLYNLSFCYSINGNLPTGLRVIDYVSRHFGVLVTDVVWDSLLHWAFVLSRPKPSAHPDPASLDLEAVYRVWNTMQMPPYEVKPSLSMYDALIKTYWTAGKYNDMYATMTEAFDVFWEDTKLYKELWKELQTLAQDPEARHGPLEKAQKEVDEMGFMVKRGSIALKSWTKLFLASTRDTNSLVGLPQGEEMSWRHIPRMLGSKWEHFLPNRVQYYIPTGHVEIVKMTRRELMVEHAGKGAVERKRKRIMDTVQRALGHDWVHRKYSNRRLQEAGILDL